MKILKIYTDGSYKPSIKLGATAFVILKENKLITEFSRLYEQSPSPDAKVNTHNIMELQAAIDALNWLRSNNYSPKKYRIYLYTDSQYVQLGLTLVKRWRNNGWKNNQRRKIKNPLLWKYLDDLISNEFESLYVQWIEGHTGDNKWNTRADELCRATIKRNLANNIDVKIDE